jgi:uncharacterized protein (TIGR02246 family)
MKKALAGLLVSSLLVTTPAIAGPLEEVAAFGAPRAKAFMAGDAGGWTDAYADNATGFSQFSPYRLDGKAAIRAYFAEFFNRYPGPRNFIIHQPSARAYGENLVVNAGYYQLTLTDKAGNVLTSYARYSSTWAKLDGRWQIVDQQNSPMPRSR